MKNVYLCITVVCLIASVFFWNDSVKVDKTGMNFFQIIAQIEPSRNLVGSLAVAIVFAGLTLNEEFKGRS